MPISSLASVSNAVNSQNLAVNVNKNENIKMSFSDYLKNEINKTNELLLQSEKDLDDYAAGNIDNIHQVLISLEKADIALQFTTQIRNKILDAYTEIMRMQI